VSQCGVPHRRRPCAECPWRRDTPRGMFTQERYDALADTSGARGAEAPIDAPLFACHKSAEGREEACAGWLAAVGAEHLGVRLAVVSGRIPASALAPPDDWPALFASYDEMARTQGEPRT
jgi:hypothetical protein